MRFQYVSREIGAKIFPHDTDNVKKYIQCFIDLSSLKTHFLDSATVQGNQINVAHAETYLKQFRLFPGNLKSTC